MWSQQGSLAVAIQVSADKTSPSLTFVLVPFLEWLKAAEQRTGDDFFHSGSWWPGKVLWSSEPCWDWSCGRQNAVLMHLKLIWCLKGVWRLSPALVWVSQAICQWYQVLYHAAYTTLRLYKTSCQGWTKDYPCCLLYIIKEGDSSQTAAEW